MSILVYAIISIIECGGLQNVLLLLQVIITAHLHLLLRRPTLYYDFHIRRIFLYVLFVVVFIWSRNINKI